MDEGKTKHSFHVYGIRIILKKKKRRCFIWKNDEKICVKPTRYMEDKQTNKQTYTHIYIYFMFHICLRNDIPTNERRYTSRVKPSKYALSGSIYVY